jgi:diguanylate cyclase (GGDEF)-like protein
MERCEKVKVLIVGAGKGGSALLPILLKETHIEIVGMVDIREDAPGLEIAKKYGIPTATDFRELLPKANVVINVTGKTELRKDILKEKPDVEIMDGGCALIMWMLATRFEKSATLLRKIYEIVLLLASSTDMEKILNEIVHSATMLTNTPAGSLALYDESKNELSMATSLGFSEQFSRVRKWNVRIGGLTSLILSNKTPTVIEDVKKEPFFKNPVLLKEGVRSLMAIPLTVRGKIVGILYVDDFKPRKFTKEEIDSLTLLASQAAIAIEKTQLLQEIKKMAITDGLTGLYNHRHFRERLKEEVERTRRHNDFLTLLIFDLDNFKEYNDHFGHLVGDQVLKDTARIITESIRLSDIASRYGGEEFAIILPQTSLEAGIKVGERIRKKIENHVINQDGKVLGKITISGGLATYPTHALTDEELISAADEALYEAKRTGKNRVVPYNVSLLREKTCPLKRSEKSKS